MAEFGHIHASGNGVHIDGWGSGPYEITVSTRLYRFEDSDRFGPVPLKKNGDPTDKGYFPERSPFWRVWEIWRDQGRRVAEDGKTCIWEDDDVAVAAIRKAMADRAMVHNDLIPFLGARSRVSEVLSGKRSLSKSMIKRLHEGLGIPLATLLNGRTR